MADKDLKKSEVTTPVKVNAEYLKNHVSLGLEKLTQEDIPTPTLSLIQSNSTLVDKDNRPLPRGEFFYNGDGNVYKSITCSFLVMTKKELPSFDDKSVMVKTYIVMGVMEPTFKPFLLYLKNSGAGAFKQFIGELQKLQAPMFAVKTAITSERVIGEKGTYYKIKINALGIRENEAEILKLEELTRRYTPKVDADANNEDVNPEDIPF